MSVLYCCVAHGTRVLAEWKADGAGNSDQVARLILDKVQPGDDTKLTYVYKRHLIHYVTEAATDELPQGMTYLCLADESLGRRVPFTILLTIRVHLWEQFGASTVCDAPSHGLEPDFSQVIERDVREATSSVDGEGASSSMPVDTAKQVREEIDQVKHGKSGSYFSMG